MDLYIIMKNIIKIILIIILIIFTILKIMKIYIVIQIIIIVMNFMKVNQNITDNKTTSIKYNSSTYDIKRTKRRIRYNYNSQERNQKFQLKVFYAVLLEFVIQKLINL